MTSLNALLLTPNEYLDMREPEYVAAERAGIVVYEKEFGLVRVLDPAAVNLTLGMPS